MRDWKEAIYRQREELARLLHEPLARLAQRCVSVWKDRNAFNQVLLSRFADIPHCTYLYVLDADKRQLSDNVGPYGVVPGHCGRDRSHRPYMRESMPPWGFLLSDAYVSRNARRPSLTAVHVVTAPDGSLGYVGADFDLRNLPVTADLYDEPGHWQQIKGDPAIRSTVFLQRRVESPMDRNMEHAFSILGELLTERGMFQGVIRFSSSLATVWFVDDPYRYRILDHEALADPDICLAYPCRPYPAEAQIASSDIMTILSCMRELRAMDDTIYLRSSSINIFNGMLSLTFSCDGSHYMRYDEFLAKELSFWIGSAA
ncbi:MAG: hypothetical protein WCC36_19015 [Gammaproteobacteria bacterium]